MILPNLWRALVIHEGHEGDGFLLDFQDEFGHNGCQCPASASCDFVPFVDELCHWPKPVRFRQNGGF